MAIGASCLGVLAITFSLSLFAIQQAADKHTPTVLMNFIKGSKNNIIFWSIGLIALVFFVFSIAPLDFLIFWEVLLTFVLLILILYLLKKQYAHITKLVNPIHQITFHHDEAIHKLKKIDKWLDLMIKIRAIQPAPRVTTKMKLKDNSKSDQRDQLRAGLILRMPTLFDETRKILIKFMRLSILTSPAKIIK